jgi:hypothetical protein
MARLLRVIFLNILRFTLLRFAAANAVTDAHVLEKRDFSTDLRNFNQSFSFFLTSAAKSAFPSAP